jgi:arylsulfatase A-like enzyme
VPMLVKWPGVVKPGTIINDIMAAEDWMPTLIAAAGEPDVKEKTPEGIQRGRQDLQKFSRRLHLQSWRELSVTVWGWA